MTTLTLYRLEPPPGGGFHFGEQGLELEASRLTFPSDSLFSALVATVAQQEGAAAADAFLAPFLGAATAPPFRLTSVFPYAGTLPLLPVPQTLYRQMDESGKFARRVKFVSPALFRRICRGEDVTAYMPPAGEKTTENSPGRTLQKGTVWLTTEEQPHLPVRWAGADAETLRRQKIWHEGPVPRVTLDRASDTSTIYLMGRVSYNEGCGLWLGVQYEDDTWRPRVEGLLRHLSDRGIGGERNNGYGAFTLRPATDDGLSLGDLPAGESNYHVLLSRYHPHPDELKQGALHDPHAAYQLVPVGGWMASPDTQGLRRKQVTLITEGSVIAGDVLGNVANVTPDREKLPAGVDAPNHEVYRYGLALTVPVTDD